MADFSHLGQLDVGASTADFTIHQITIDGKSPTLILKPATEANKGYFNVLLKRAGKSARKVRAGSINSGLVEENRDEDRDLYPKFIVVGWKDVLDVNGVEVDFNLEDCIKFLAQLPNWVFDDIRNFAGDPSNFIEMIDLEINAKN